jgi:hypothetical protein
MKYVKFALCFVLARKLEFKGLFGMAPEQNSKGELVRACQTP